MTKQEISPLNLLQEIYIEDSWKILVCCIMLNQTTRKQVDKIRTEFFLRYPTPQMTMDADVIEMSEMIKCLGFRNRRSSTIIRMSREYLENKWTYPIELHGCGIYADQSYRIFVLGEIIKNPTDHVLKNYIEWLTNNK